MSENESMTATWEKILEYASSPLHGTMSRKLRKGVSLQINTDPIFDNSEVFVSDNLLRLTNVLENGDMQNSYYDLSSITSIKTVSTEKK